MKNCRYSISTNHCSGKGGFSGLRRVGHRNTGFKLKPVTVFPCLVVGVDVIVKIVGVRAFNIPPQHDSLCFWGNGSVGLLLKGA